MRRICGWWMWRRLSIGTAVGISSVLRLRRCGGYSSNVLARNRARSKGVIGAEWGLEIDQIPGIERAEKFVALDEALTRLELRRSEEGPACEAEVFRGFDGQVAARSTWDIVHNRRSLLGLRPRVVAAGDGRGRQLRGFPNFFSFLWGKTGRDFALLAEIDYQPYQPLQGATEMNEETIFSQAIEKPENERSAYLDHACRDDAELRRRVEALLAAHDSPDSFLEDPIGDGEPTIGKALNARPGAVIGPYKLREQIGEGGMGVVWAAEQKHPLRRKVALKLIKPGMDSSAVIARFEAEREALSLMDHPNVARVLDAGTTEQGHPYFVMELICGVPITEYCDTNKLSVPERLDLVHAGLPSSAARPPERDHPSRHQTDERAGHDA